MRIFFDNQILIPVAAAAAFAVGRVILRGGGPKAVKILRLAALAGTLTLATGAGIRFDAPERKRVLAVMIDVSDSMFVTKRIDAVNTYLKNNRSAMEREFELKFFKFRAGPESITAAQSEKLLPGGGPTDIEGSLRAVARGGAGGIDGIFLFSDGAQTAADPRGSGAESSVAGTPVFPLDAFGGERIRDISISGIKKAGIAFKGAETAISVVVRNYGFGAKTVEFHLSAADGSVAKTGRRAIQEGENEVKIVFTPNKTGKTEFSVAVSTFPGELTHLNNKADFTADVLRDKIRVLYLCGRPSYEYSFLREFLKNDPAVELVTFVILRNPENVALVPDEELSLIPFPGADVLMKQLPDFDAVIFENFTYRRFGIYPDHLEIMKKWTADGGGFLMIGGENSFGAGGYRRTAVGEILPVIMEDGGETAEPGLFKPAAVNYDSPVFYSEGDEREFWKGLGHLEWLQKLPPRPDASVLIRHPWVKIGGDNAPVLAVRHYFKGRTAALMTNSTWRWKMTSSNAGLYDTFWKNLLAFLTSSEEKTKTRIVGLAEAVAPGEECSFVVRKIAEASRVAVSVADSRGVPVPAAAAERGEYAAFSFIAENEGIYTIDIKESVGGRLTHRETRRIKASPPGIAETLALEADRGNLSRIAGETSGALVPPGAFDAKILGARMKDRVGKDRASSKKLSESGAAIALLAAIILAELVIRWKKYGLW